MLREETTNRTVLAHLVVSAKNTLNIDKPAGMEKEAYLVYDSLVSESNVPQTETHIPIETKVHSPTHPTRILLLEIDFEQRRASTT